MAQPLSHRACVAVVLSGCGFKDGTETTEAISALIALSEAGAEAQCFAPDADFIPARYAPRADAGPTAAAGSARNALEESGRLCRGRVLPLHELREENFDALVFPGGWGAATLLSDWAAKGSKCKVRPEIESAIRSFHRASKPIGAICVAPALVARVLGSEGVTVTVGEDAETVAEIEKTGARHARCPVEDYVSDRDNKVLTTPAYMYEEPAPHLVFEGVRRMIRELVEMA